MVTAVRFRGPLAGAWPGPAVADACAALRPPGDCLPVPPATDRSRWDAAALDAAALQDLRARALPERGTPWPQTLLRTYARCFRDGNRDEYEQVVLARQHRLGRAAVLAAVTLEEDWLDEVADGVTLLCEQTTWCWPAHDDTPRQSGHVLPAVTRPFLDLGAGEVVGQLAWIDHLLGAPLDARAPGLRQRVRHEARVRVLDPFEQRRDWHWLGLAGDAHNWNPWIHGNVLLAVLQFEDDPQRRAHLVDLVVEGLDRYVATLPADGAIDEGYAYWWNGACRALEALDLLRHATDGRLDAFTVPALRATVAFPHRMHLGGPWYLNVADGPARPPADVPWRALHRAARCVGDDGARRHAAAHREPGRPVADERAGLGRLLLALTDTDWTDAGGTSGTSAADGTADAGGTGSPLPRDVWFPSTQVLLARPAAGVAGGLTLAVKGGHNGEHHNHNDVGSVVVALGGVPVLVDAGRPTYTAQTFGPDRYSIWTMHSDWHNVPRIRGTAQHEGRRFRARDVVARRQDGCSGLRLDLAAAYPRDDVRRWWRTAVLDRTTGRVTVTDSWELDGRGAHGDAGPAPSTVHLLLAGDVRLVPGGAVVAALLGAGTVSLAWDAAAPVALEVCPLDDPWLTDVWGDHLTRLSIEVGAAPAGSLTVTVEETR